MQAQSKQHSKQHITLQDIDNMIMIEPILFVWNFHLVVEAH